MKDHGRPKGKMSSYAFFVTTCRDEHKKKHPGTPVNFSEFSKKCSERWKVTLLQHNPNYTGYQMVEKMTNLVLNDLRKYLFLVVKCLQYKYYLPD